MIIVPAVSDPIRTARQAAERARCLAYGLLAAPYRCAMGRNQTELES